MASLRRRAFLALLAPPPSFTTQLWQRIQPTYQATLAHPFLRGLTDGSLPRDRFEYYLAQDSLYLRAFGQALNVLASKAPREEWSLTLSQHSIDALKAEREMHEKILASYGAKPAAEMAPANRAYTNHLLTAVHRHSFTEGLAAMLPCYWIYWEVGKELVKKGSPNKDYQRWIDQYASPGYGDTVSQVLKMMNEAAAADAGAARSQAAYFFELSARYEYRFWDAAWRLESW